MKIGQIRRQLERRLKFFCGGRKKAAVGVILREDLMIACRVRIERRNFQKALLSQSSVRLIQPE